MNRRDFLSMLSASLGGIALKQAIPLNRVWSFPTNIVLPGKILMPPNTAVRFIKAYDLVQGRMVCRLDILSSCFEPYLPQRIQDGYVIRNESNASFLMPDMPRVPPNLISDLAADLRLNPLGEKEIRGIQVPSK